jgi:hypothetical protein
MSPFPIDGVPRRAEIINERVRRYYTAIIILFIIAALVCTTVYRYTYNNEIL